MRPLIANKPQPHLHSVHSNSVGTIFNNNQPQNEHHQYLFSNSSGGLSTKPIGKSSSFGGIIQKSNSPNTSNDNMTPLLLKNRMAAPKAIDKEISKWSCQDVGIWLDWMKLSHLKQIFFQNQISGDELLELTDAEIINDLKVRDENERKSIKELIDNREVWMKQGSKKLSNDSLDSLDEYSKPISPIGSTQSLKYPNMKQIPNTKSSLELDEFSDCDDLTSVGGIFLDRSTIGSQKLEILLETLYKDMLNVKFKVYRGSDIYVITQKRSLLSFTSLKLEIIERYQCVKPIILYKTRDGDFIKISRDEDLARVISSYHQNGGDISQPIKLQIEINDLPIGLVSGASATTNSASTNHQINTINNTNQSLQSPREWTYSSDQSQTSTNSLPPNNQLAQKLIELELDNIEKNNSIRELEIRLHNQQVENEKQTNYSKSLQDDISSLKMQLYSYKNGTVFNPGMSKQEEIGEYIKLCKSLQSSLSTAQNKLFELIGNQL